MAVSIYSPETKEAKRVAKAEAQKLVATGNWQFISKTDFVRISTGQISEPAT